MYANGLEESAKPSCPGPPGPSLDGEWQKSKKEPMERLRYLLETGDSSDVTFQVYDSKGYPKLFRAHKVVLIMTSHVFKEIFKNNPNPTIDIEGLEHDAFFEILRYAYTNSPEFCSIRTVIKMAEAAQRYQMVHLFEATINHLKSNISKENVLQLLEASFRVSDLGLQDYCQHFINTTVAFRNYLSSPSLPNLSAPALKLILDRCYCLNQIPLKDVYGAVHKWAKSRCGEGWKSCIREHIELFLPCLDILTLNSKEFLHAVVASNALSEEETAAVRANLEKHEGGSVEGSLPEWCSLCYKDESFIFFSFIEEWHRTSPEPITPEKSWVTRFVTTGCAAVLNLFTVETNNFVEMECSVKINGSLLDNTECTVIPYQKNARTVLCYYHLKPISLKKGRNEVKMDLRPSGVNSSPIRALPYDLISNFPLLSDNFPKFSIKFDPNRKGIISAVSFFVQRKSYLIRQ